MLQSIHEYNILNYYSKNVELNKYLFNSSTTFPLCILKCKYQL